MKRIRLVSVSGGKDSTATLLLALETNWQDDVRAVFADTGNEHDLTLEYVCYLEQATGLRIEWVKADFANELIRKRKNLERIAAGEPEIEIYKGREFKHPWTPEAARKAIPFMEATGNPFLDLCILKGGFPSRSKLFCSEKLKHEPMEAWTYSLIDEGHSVEVWQGVRADESPKRAKQPDFEWGPVISTRRPILRWGVERVFEQHRRHGIKPNPLYTMGFRRVGCMPCINSGKADLATMAQRFPEQVEKIREYERVVGESWRPMPFPPSFIPPSNIRGAYGIDAAVAWSRTKRGGDVRQSDAFHEAEPEMCSSMYGLCE